MEETWWFLDVKVPNLFFFKDNITEYVIFTILISLRSIFKWDISGPILLKSLVEPDI